jgi:mannose-1-phosphate guanylyltransferase
VQALILAGGEGTRLRPLTSTIPKPVVPLAGRPFISYMIEWLRRHGVDDVIMSCGFLADGVRRVLADGAELGVRLRYVEEPKPLGTAGALKYAEELLDERFLMLNGDILADLDLTAQLAQHQATGARATICLVPVDDPSAYGLVRSDGAGAVTGFLEKPSPEEIGTSGNLVNAGAYVLERDVLGLIAPVGTNCSIERDVFPALVGDGLYAYASTGYWLDIGTPARYLQATYDILHGIVETELGAALASCGGVLADGAQIAGTVVPPALVGARAVVAPGATVGPTTVLGAGVELGEGVVVEGSSVLEGTRVEEWTRIEGSIIGPGVTIGVDCRIRDGVVLGEGVRIGPGNTLAAGARIFPGVELPKGAISF